MPEDATAGAGMLTTLLTLVFFLGVMYLLIIRPQKRREKKTRQMIDAMAVGDEVITIGGITGKVVNIKDDEITVETGVEKTKLNFKKWAVKEVKELIKA